MKMAGLHSMLDIARETQQAPPMPAQNLPVGEQFRAKGNPDKQIDQVLGSVMLREGIEGPPAALDMPEIDLTVERLRKSSSERIWPEVAELLDMVSAPTVRQKMAAEANALLGSLGRGIRQVTTPKYAAACARVVLEKGSYPHIDVTDALWKSAVLRDVVADPQAMLLSAQLPKLAEDTWTKLAAAQVVLRHLAPEFDKEAWSQLIDDADQRDRTFELCEQLLAEGRCSPRR